jgi:hypothetical protein
MDKNAIHFNCQRALVRDGIVQPFSTKPWPSFFFPFEEFATNALYDGSTILLVAIRPADLKTST